MPLDATLSSLLSEMHDAVDAMQEPHEAESRNLAGPFLSRLFHIGVRLHRDPVLLESEEVQRLLRRGDDSPRSESAAHVRAYAHELRDLIRDSWEGEAGVFVDHWARACTERSALEFAREFFPSLLGLNHDDILRTLEETDAIFKTKIDRFDVLPHPEQRPAGVPYAHWWWRYDGPLDTTEMLASST